MAIINKYVENNTGLTIENAYYRVRRDTTINSDGIVFCCDIYSSQESKNTNKSPIASIEYKIDAAVSIPSNEDDRASVLYGLLKDEVGFENSIDI